MGESGDGKNPLRKRWVETSLELACLRCGVTQREPIVDFSEKEKHLAREIERLEKAILSDAESRLGDEDVRDHE